MTPVQLVISEDRQVAVEALFWSKVAREDTCWHWTGAFYQKGYGHFSFWDHGTAINIGAHRYAYLVTYGSIPEGLQLDHLCRNKDCVNPWHLEAVTPMENRRRAVAFLVPVTHCPKGHPYAGDNLFINWNGYRGCITCRRVNQLACPSYRRRQHKVSA